MPHKYGMENNEELGYLYQQTFLGELSRKTSSGALIWNTVSAGQYTTSADQYAFHLTKTNIDHIVLDVLKDGALFASYNSSVESVIADLYTEVTSISDTKDTDKSKDLTNFLQQLPDPT